MTTIVDLSGQRGAMAGALADIFDRKAKERDAQDLLAAQQFADRTKGLMPDQVNALYQEYVKQNPGAARYLRGYAVQRPYTMEEQYKKDLFSPDAPSQPQMPPPPQNSGGDLSNNLAQGAGFTQQSPAQPQQQRGDSLGSAYKKEVQRALFIFGPDGVKQLLDSAAMQISQLPPAEQMNALRVFLKTAVDANTQLTQQTATENSQRTLEGTKYTADAGERNSKRSLQGTMYSANTGRWAQGVDPTTGRLTFVNPATGETMATDQQPVATYNAGKNKPATQAEKVAMNFYVRLKDVDDALNAKPNGGPSLEETIANYGLVKQGRLQLTPNFTQSPEMQVYRQLQRQFTEARLRKESGAAIPPSEFENDAKTYFVQPGDSPEVIARKRAARSVVEGTFKQMAGNAYHEYYNGTQSGAGNVVYIDPNTGEPIQ